jgi:hypothetical protein
MGGVGPLMVMANDPESDPGLGLRPGLPGVQVDAFIFSGRQSGSLKLLSRQRPLPSIEIWGRPVSAGQSRQRM